MQVERQIFNSGQRRVYQDGEQPAVYPRMQYRKAPVIQTEKPLEIHPSFQEKDYVILGDVTEFLEGLNTKMIDWWWGNMEKGYYLWAPGEHYGFEWVVPPCEAGYEGSVEASYEFDPVYPLVIERESIREYPFTECYSHCWMGKAQMGDALTHLIHMYKDVEDGIYWRTVQFVTREDAARLPEDFGKSDGKIQAHMEYESGRFSCFLPQLYELWKDHPDPWQNVRYNLETQKNPDGTWSHKYENRPPQKTGRE